MCDKPAETPEAFMSRMRELCADHEPDGWPAVQQRDIARLCNMVESAVPALDRLQDRLEAGRSPDV